MALDFLQRKCLNWHTVSRLRNPELYHSKYLVYIKLQRSGVPSPKEKGAFHSGDMCLAEVSRLGADMGRVQQPQALSREVGVTYTTAAAHRNGLLFGL